MKGIAAPITLPGVMYIFLSRLGWTFSLLGLTVVQSYLPLPHSNISKVLVIALAFFHSCVFLVTDVRLCHACSLALQQYEAMSFCVIKSCHFSLMGLSCWELDWCCRLGGAVTMWDLTWQAVTWWDEELKRAANRHLKFFRISEGWWP